jgi:hypothetical protein
MLFLQLPGYSDDLAVLSSPPSVPLLLLLHKANFVVLPS